MDDKLLGMALCLLIHAIRVQSQEDIRSNLSLASGSQSLDSSARNIRVLEITELLDGLLIDYDQTLRPVLKGQPTKIYINIYVRSMGPVSEMDGSYALDCYFRQAWFDGRLRFLNGSEEALSLSMSMLDKIWKPDTFFWNGIGSYLHKLTQPNRLVRLKPNGVVLYSARLTIIARCNMNLRYFPFDTQRCPLLIGSFAYTNEDLVFSWMKGPNGSVMIPEDLEMSQFTVQHHAFEAKHIMHRNGNYSYLEVRFVMSRHVGYFLINFYLPCSMVVLLSWVSFWINREATADRVSLGITTILTLTFLSQDSRSDVPKVSYPTALDVYILQCYAFLFLGIIEFTLVHVSTKFASGDPEIEQLRMEQLRQKLAEYMPARALFRAHKNNQNKPSVKTQLSNGQLVTIAAKKSSVTVRMQRWARHVWYTDRRNAFLVTRQQQAQLEADKMHHHETQPLQNAKKKVHFEKCNTTSDENGSDSEYSQDDVLVQPWQLQPTQHTSEPTNSLSRIDAVCRWAFPVCYVLSVLLYYKIYVH